MRTGSIGNRDAESLINTLVEPKKTLLAGVRKELLALGYEEEAGYDAINIESFVAYSTHGLTRFIFKHKWSLAVVLVMQDEEEKQALQKRLPEVAEQTFETNEEDGTLWAELNPERQKDLIVALAKFFWSDESKLK